jgi:peptidoglycan-N-acetylglucosamine deacetylase
MNRTLILKSLLQTLSLRRFLFKVPDKPRTLFLTFDDGPDPIYTPKILEILNHHRIHASFFLVGQQVEQHAEILHQIKLGSHTVGLHTHSHQSIISMDKAQLATEIEQNQNAIHEVLGLRPSLLRPPRGEISLSSLYHAMKLGLKVVHYTITSNDWKLKSPEAILNQIYQSPISGGDIISFHDNNENTCIAVDSLITEYKERGYSFSSLQLIE